MVKPNLLKLTLKFLKDLWLYVGLCHWWPVTDDACGAAVSREVNSLEVGPAYHRQQWLRFPALITAFIATTSSTYAQVPN